MVKRYFWLGHLLLITLAAILGADMVKAYLSAKLAAPLPARPRQAGNVPDRQTQAAPADYVVINERNIFNANPPKEPTDPVKPPPPPPPQAVQPTQLQLKLVGTLAGASQQRFAIIEDLTKRGFQALYQVGDVVQNVPITAISPDCVVFNNAGQSEELCFQPDGTEPQPPPQRQSAPARAPATLPPDNNTGIARVDGSTWSVSRELIVEQLGNFGNLSAQARMMPHMVQGQTQGFRLTQLLPDSTLQQLGLLSGDVLQKVNGLDLNSPDKALQAFQQLHNESTVRLELLRQNRPTTLTYIIR
jgi:general secretion pathway protein C